MTASADSYINSHLSGGPECLLRKCAEISSAPGLLAYSAGLSSAQPGRGEPTQRRCGACYARSVRAWMRSSIASSATSSGRVSRWTWVRSRPPCRAASVARARSPGSARQVTAGVHGPEPVADPGLPATPATAMRAASSISATSAPRVPIGQPPRHSSERWCSTRRSRQARRPGSVSRWSRCGPGCPTASSVIDDRADQGLLVLEVVVHLRAAHPGRRPDVLQRRLGHAALEDELRRGRHDPLPGLRPRRVSRRSVMHETSTNWIGQPSFRPTVGCNPVSDAEGTT